jgi:UrcA family protein
MSRIVLGSFAAAVALTGLAPQAFAEDRTYPVEIHIRTDATDFGNPKQVQSLYHRIQSAVHLACGSDEPYDNDAQSAQVRDCETQLTNDAVRRVNRPELSQVDRRERGSERTIYADRR